MIFSNKSRLDKWRDDRYIYECPSYEVYVRNILEELLEPIYNKADIPTKVHDLMQHIHIGNSLGYNDIIDAVSDIRVFSINQTELMGYNSDECLSETIDEISSRKQDTEQALKWSMSGYDGEKWKKDSEQDKSTLYVANYKGCKYEK